MVEHIDYAIDYSFDYNDKVMLAFMGKLKQVCLKLMSLTEEAVPGVEIEVKGVKLLIGLSCLTINIYLVIFMNEMDHTIVASSGNTVKLTLVPSCRS